MFHYYYTAASKEYTYKVLLLYYSLMKHDKFFKLFIICMHGDSRRMFESFGLDNAVLIDIEALESYDSELAAAKNRRNIKQYSWAVKPTAALYIFEYFREVNHIIWLDGDTVLLSSPEPIYQEWGEYPVALTEEKFTGRYEHIASIYGFYNTGFMGFKRSEEAKRCLQYFREKLMEWNYDEKEQYRWNDQLYVSDWPERFGNIGIIKNHGVNMTPFIFNRLLNETNCSLQKEDGCLYMGEVKITLFHFYGLSHFNNNEYELCSYTDIYDQSEIDLIYHPYIEDSVKMIDRIREIDKLFYVERPADKRSIRNYYYRGITGHSNRIKGKGPRRISSNSLITRADSQMKNGNGGE